MQIGKKMTLSKLDWVKILNHVTTKLEQLFKIQLYIEANIVTDIRNQLANLQLPSSSDLKAKIAKVAGHITFWIRKLKPVNFLPAAHANQNNFLTVNELAAILVGAGVIEHYKKIYPKNNLSFTLPGPILSDWAYSYRYNVHSPDSCALAFEMLFR
jgi:hypothetical protein